MVYRLLAALLICTSVVVAQVAQPATSGPTTRARLRTPDEIFAELQAEKERQAKLLKVAHFHLNEAIAEKPADFSLFGEPSPTLQSLLDRIRKAKDDANIKAALITISGAQVNLAQAQELRDALADLKQSGKRVFVYADGFDTADYTLATGASDICMMEGGQIMIPGVGLSTMFVRGLLDKVGVKPDFVQIGEYKGAEEQFTRTKPSPELTEELNKVVDALYGQIVDGIAKHRNLPKQDVRAMIDLAAMNGATAKTKGYVDHLVDLDGLRELIARELKGDIDLLSGYGHPDRQQIDFSNPFALFTLLMKKPVATDKPAVAVIYADGPIMDGEGGATIFGGNIVGSDDIRKAVREAMADQNIKAVVLRIDSPGGSASASEAMFLSLRRLAEKKPFIVSVGSMAASGGYYIAVSGDTIYADPGAIVGSIGVVGGKFVMADLFKNIGITTESFTRGANADLFSSDKPWTDQQRNQVKAWMEETYELFTRRVMQTRKDRIKDIDKVARGRIFLASQAKDLGMIDEVGGMNAAVAAAAGKAGLVGDYDIKALPAPKSFADLLGGEEENELRSGLRPAVQQKLGLSDTSPLHALSPRLRRLLGQQMQVLQLLQDRPVVLVNPYLIEVR